MADRARWNIRSSEFPLAALLRDLIGFAGAVAILYGVAQWSVPGAWVLGGGLAILVALRA